MTAIQKWSTAVNHLNLGDELVEFIVTKRNSQFLFGPELGLFSNSNRSDLINIQKGKIRHSRTGGREFKKMNNLKVNERFGVVWRQTPSSDGLGSAFLILNGTDEFEIASGISPSKIYIKLNGNVDEIRLVPESERSRLWCPHSTCLTNRISLYPVRHSYQSNYSLKWDSRLNAKNVKISRLKEEKEYLEQSRNEQGNTIDETATLIRELRDKLLESQSDVNKLKRRLEGEFLN